MCFPGCGSAWGLLRVDDDLGGFVGLLAPSVAVFRHRLGNVADKLEKCISTAKPARKLFTAFASYV